MRYLIRFDLAAEEDLAAIYRFVAEKGDPITAYGYVRRIVEACRTLQTFPKRGSSREDIRKGLRIVGFERRVTIAFCVDQDEVRVVRVLYGGRDFASIDLAEPKDSD